MRTLLPATVLVVALVLPHQALAFGLATTVSNNDLDDAAFTQQLFDKSARAYASLTDPYANDTDLAWTNNPRQWHQQTARIVDHRFFNFSVFKKFATDAKKAGVSALMLVQPHKTEACPGPWYNGLQLCDHINGSYPASDGTLEEWQQVLEEIKPMKLMWWM